MTLVDRLELEFRQDRNAFFYAMLLGLLLHASAILAMALMPGAFGVDEFQTLAVLDFSEYDPLGGQGGVEGVQPDEAMVFEEPEPIAEIVEPEPEPEIEEPIPILESLSEKAEEVPPPPPPPDEPRAETPRPRPTPRPTATPTEGSGTGTGLAAGSGGPGPGGTAGGTGFGNPDAVKAYQARIRQRLERNKKYPPAAQVKRLTGVCTVSFVVTRDGTVHSPRLVTSSGHQVLDDEALALLRRVSPLPPFPAAIESASLSLTVPLRFSLR
ncbi:MAG: energy transducer TonB [Deltaproteobacteria bacterium]|jgi:protein TonB|nr:energy transducer TonB [Deltaproteobacteria bacterium]